MLQDNKKYDCEIQGEYDLTANAYQEITGSSQQPRGHWRRKKARARLSALVLSACLTASCVFGFAGGYVSNRLKSGAGSDAAAGEVLYQSVIRNVAVGDSSASSAMTVPQVAAAVKQTVVEITTETVSTNGRMGQLISEGAGSGVIISQDGFIVTNNHVISDASSISVRLADGTEHKAQLVGTDSKADLAVIKIEAAGLTPAVLGESSSLAVGETMVAVGNPLGELGGTVTCGILSALDRLIAIDGETMSLLQTDTAINPGNSGGGLFNLYGELVGIVNAKSSGTDVEGLGFAIPMDTAKAVIEDLIEYGYVRGQIETGLTVMDISTAQSAMMYRVNAVGLYITKSANSGLQAGDRIWAVNGTEITGLADYNSALSGSQVGDTVEITVIRSGQSVTVQIVLTEKNG